MARLGLHGAPRVELRLTRSTDAIPCGFDPTTFRLSAPWLRPRPAGSGDGSSPRRGTGTAAGARRCFCADRRSTGVGCNRRRREREGEGPTGGRPGGDLGGAADARRPAAVADRVDLAEWLAEPGPSGETRIPGPGTGSGEWGSEGERRPGGTARGVLPGLGLVRTAAG